MAIMAKSRWQLECEIENLRDQFHSHRHIARQIFRDQAAAVGRLELLPCVACKQLGHRECLERTHPGAVGKDERLIHPHCRPGTAWDRRKAKEPIGVKEERRE